MADNGAIANVTAAVLQHLQNFGADAQQSTPIVLCQPARLGTIQGIAISMWRLTAAARNQGLPARNISGLRVSPPVPFDLHFIGISGAHDVVVQHEQLGWLLCALLSNPVIPVNKPSSDNQAHQPPPAGLAVNVAIEQLDDAVELSLRASLNLTTPIVSFVARSALISLEENISPLPVLER